MEKLAKVARTMYAITSGLLKRYKVRGEECTNSAARATVSAVSGDSDSEVEVSVVFFCQWSRSQTKRAQRLSVNEEAENQSCASIVRHLAWRLTHGRTNAHVAPIC